MRIALSVAGAALALGTTAVHAAQPAYPDKPIRLIIGSAPGSGPDIISRALSERLYKSWNQRVVVDSRPGAAGVISADLTLQAAPDGYTWMMLTSQLLVATSVFHDVKFDLGKDFASVALIGSTPFVLSVNPQLPVKSVSELIDLAKKQPGKLRYGSAGTGASEHLCGLMFTQLTGTKMLHVPYKGVAQALTDAAANEVQLTYGVVSASLAFINGGRVRAIGVTSKKRSSLLPDVPSISETVPGYDLFGWYSIVAPKGTPAPILEKVSSEIVKAVKEPAFGEHLKALGIEIIGAPRQELDKFRAEQTARVKGLVKTAGSDLK
ncbi:MAG TPA: tripartite tricarboxylate transporter substrate-binding protein [Burkholderiales bacterium]|nr:tripartite tricarboxylate transporter substrate-binding protein [Burkholderiales bacterium]